MSEKNIKSFIDELIKEVEDELDEANVTGNVDGYDTPNAFSGKNSDKKRKKTATQFGYTLVNNDINNIDESVNEAKVGNPFGLAAKVLQSLGFTGGYVGWLEGISFEKQIKGGVLQITIVQWGQSGEQYAFDAVFFPEITKSTLFGLIKKKVIDYRNGKWVSKDKASEIVDLGTGMFELSDDDYEKEIKTRVKNAIGKIHESIKLTSLVNEASLQKGKTYGGSKCEGGCFIGKEGLKKIIKISKDSPNDIFMFRDDNYSGLQPHFIKDGVIAKATTINPAYDLEKNKVRNLNIGKDVILSVRLFVSTNESVNEAILNEDTKRVNILGIDFNISEMNGRIFFSFIDKKAASIKIREIGTNKIVNLIQNSLDKAYGKGEFFFKGGDHAEFQNGYLFQRSIGNIKLNKLKFEALDPKAEKFLDAIQVNDRSIKDLKNITVDATPQGNWSVYYKGKRMFTLNGKMLDDKTIMKYGLEHMDESLSEGKKIQRPVNRWLELKNDESMHANKKLATGLRELKYQLKEVETFFRWYNQIKTMNELSSDTFWKRTHGHIYKIKERLINIAKTIQEIEK